MTFCHLNIIGIDFVLRLATIIKIKSLIKKIYNYELSKKKQCSLSIIF